MIPIAAFMSFSLYHRFIVECRSIVLLERHSTTVKKKMTKNTRRVQRGETSLSREHIIEAAVSLLDELGESGLTFRALAERLATGAGAIYWHIADKGDLLDAACDAIVAHALAGAGGNGGPRDTIRAIARGLFDALDAHPWVGTQLTRAPSRMPMVRILETIGRQVRALGIPEARQWQAGSALLNYMLGVAGQNAANGQFARDQKLERAAFLTAVAAQWSALDADAYPFTRSMAWQLAQHDDRADFLAGIDLILNGIGA
jgi:AcrR family transcriptional regulator